MELSKVFRDFCRAWECMKLIKVGYIVSILALRPIPFPKRCLLKVLVKNENGDLTSGSTGIDEVSSYHILQFG